MKKAIASKMKPKYTDCNDLLRIMKRNIVRDNYNKNEASESNNHKQITLAHTKFKHDQ